MSWPDDSEPRFVADTAPTVRVLDRCYAHRVVREWRVNGWRSEVASARLAASLNAADETVAA